MRARNKARDSQQQHEREVLQQYQRLRIIVTDSLKDQVFSSSPLCIFLTSVHLPHLCAYSSPTIIGLPLLAARKAAVPLAKGGSCGGTRVTGRVARTGHLLKHT